MSPVPFSDTPSAWPSVWGPLRSPRAGTRGSAIDVHPAEVAQNGITPGVVVCATCS